MSAAHWFECAECLALAATPNIRAACATVAIEHGLTTTQVASEYLQSNHARHTALTPGVPHE